MAIISKNSIISHPITIGGRKVTPSIGGDDKTFYAGSNHTDESIERALKAIEDYKKAIDILEKNSANE